MKRLGALLAIIALCFSAMSSPITVESSSDEKPYNWQPIIGYKHPTRKAFYDRNNTHKEIIEKTEFGTGAILVFDTKNSEIIIRGRKVIFKSMIKYLMVDCSTGMMVPMFDYFYDKEFPTQEDQPLAGVEYEARPSNYTLLNKTSLIYLTMCPIQI